MRNRVPVYGPLRVRDERRGIYGYTVGEGNRNSGQNVRGKGIVNVQRVVTRESK